MAMFLEEMLSVSSRAVEEDDKDLFLFLKNLDQNEEDE